MALMPRRERLRRPSMRQVVVVLPSAFTLGNLFFGFWSIVTAFNGKFQLAGWFIVFAGILDMLDGRVARFSKTPTKFGAELDSLVDVVSFGIAPALLIYFLDFANAGSFSWILCYIYVTAVALRLARFNVIAAGGPSTSWFTGLPSPAAGIILAVYYPFSQTEWYTMSLAYLDLQHQGLVMLLLLLAVLMVSTVKYPKFPSIGFRTGKSIVGTTVLLAVVVCGVVAPEYLLFPLGLAYTLFGILRAVMIGLMEETDPAELADERLADANDPASAPPPLSPDPRSAWSPGDRDEEPDE